MKASFTDGDGREWKLRLSVGLVAEVLRETGVEIGNEKNSQWVALLFGQQAKLVEVLWVLCAGQAETFGVSAEAFGYLFDGATLEAAGDALAGAVADFFPRSKISRAIKDHMGKVIQAGEERAIREMTAAAVPFSTSATTSPGSAGSTPTP